MLTILPGLVEIGYVAAEKLPKNIALKGRAGAPVSVLTDINWVDLNGEGHIESTASYENHEWHESTELTFAVDTDTHLPLGEHVGWVARHPSGTMWLVGAREAPHPVMEVTISSGEKAGEAAIKSVRVTAKGLKTLTRLYK